MWRRTAGSSLRCPASRRRSAPDGGGGRPQVSCH
uniref:Uncharacterized protein n=1 Tax=Arundo donax TaxID=35708 RepID=A0A0A9DGA8_ARUDO